MEPPFSALGHDQKPKVFHENQEVGFITSGFYSVSLERNIALASVKADLSEIGTAFEIELKNGKIRAECVNRPFIDPERKTQMPAPAL